MLIIKVTPTYDANKNEDKIQKGNYQELNDYITKTGDLHRKAKVKISTEDQNNALKKYSFNKNKGINVRNKISRDELYYKNNIWSRCCKHTEMSEIWVRGKAQTMIF